MNPFRHLRPVPEQAAATEPSDDASTLLLRVAHGDEAAFAALYDELARLVFGIALRVVHDRTHAEEITQEVFLDVWRLAARFDPARGSARSWVATMAHRRAVDRVRSEEASRSRHERAGRLEPVTAAEVDEVAGDHVDRERVLQALGRLTPAQRETIELAYFGGHTYRQVAVLLDMPEGTVKTRIRDGLIRLRDILGTSP